MAKSLLKIYIFILIVLPWTWLVPTSSVAAKSGNLYTKPPSSQPATAPYQPATTKLYDLIHTRLEVKFDWGHQQLHGIATVQVKPHFYPQQQLLLDAHDLIIHSVFILADEEKKEALYTYNNHQLTITLEHLYTKEDVITVEINYTTQSNQTKSKNKFKLGGNQGLYFINPDGKNTNKPQQIWTQGEPNTNSYWFPTLDAPNQRCTQETYITVEDKFKTLSNGILVYSTLNEDQTRTDYWRMELPHAPYLFMLAVGEFAEVQDEWNDIPVTYYVESEYKDFAKKIFKNTNEMLTFFSEKLDYPYPWPSCSQVIVRDYLAGGMENTTTVVLAENIQGNDRALLDKTDRDEVIAHELFHHWFGNLVTCESWGQVPIHESFASWGAHLWYSHKYGPYERDRLLAKSIEAYLSEAQFKQVSVIRNYYTYPLEMFDSHTYHKGTLILHMLKTYLGEQAFLQSLSEYLKKYAFSTTDIHQLRKSFEEVSGQDLNWFFNQWFLAPGHPLLHVEHTYIPGKLSLKIWQKQASPVPIYQLPLAIDIWVKEKKERYHITVDKAYQEFTFSLPQQPQAVYIDRNYFLVGEIEYSQNTQAYQYLYTYGEDFFAKHEAIRYFSDKKTDSITYYNFFKDLLQDKYWGFQIIALDAFRGYRQQEKNYPAISLIEKRLITLTQAPHSLVREKALEILSSWQSPSTYTSIYKESLADSSYRVASAALYAYATYGHEEQKSIKDHILLSFENDDDLNIILKLATYYTNTKKPDKYQWLKEKTSKLYAQLSFESLLTCLAQYTYALANHQQEETTLALLQDIVTNNSTTRIRRAAYKALQILPQNKAVKKLLNVIIIDE